MCSPYMAKACPVIHSQGALQRMQALGGILVTGAELCTGKTANGPFFSFVKCASHDVRGKVPSGVIPTLLPLLAENQKYLIGRTVKLIDRVFQIHVSIKESERLENGSNCHFFGGFLSLVLHSG